MRWMVLAGLMCGMVIVASACLAGEEEGWISLFNGKDLTGWKMRNPNAKETWKANDGVLDNTDKGSDLYTEQKFKDFQLHIEFKVPKGGNSGVYLRGRYEIQVADSFGGKPEPGSCGGIYGQYAPSENASKPADEWQSFDVTLVGMQLTVLHNGKKIHDNVTLKGDTGGSMGGKAEDAGPLMLQGDHTKIQYRNIKVKPIEAKPVEK